MKSGNATHEASKNNGLLPTAFKVLATVFKVSYEIATKLSFERSCRSYFIFFKNSKTQNFSFNSKLTKQTSNLPAFEHQTRI
jgi:hypothetical protein